MVSEVYVGTCPGYVSLSCCFYGEEPWFLDKSHVSQPVDVGLISLDDTDWVRKLGDAFALGDDDSKIPRLVWEIRENV